MFTTRIFAGLAVAATSVAAHAQVSAQVSGPCGSNGVLGDLYNTRITQGGVPFTPGRIYFEADVTANNAFTYLSELQLNVTAPNGQTRTFSFSGVNQNWTDTRHFGPVELTGANFPAVLFPAGTWSFEFSESFDDVASAPDAIWTDVSISVQANLDQPVPQCLDFGRLYDTGNAYDAVGFGTFSSSPVRWYTFQTDAINAIEGDYLEINTLGSDLPPIDDTVIAVYRFAGGATVAGNDDADSAGGIYTSRVRFGAGAGSFGDLLSGRYYVGVTTFPNSFLNSPYLASINSSALAGSYSVNIDTNLSNSSIPCPGDIDGDRSVGLTDLALLLSNFGLSDVSPNSGDLDGDMDVDLTDLATLLTQFGTVCP